MLADYVSDKVYIFRNTGTSGTVASSSFAIEPGLSTGPAGVKPYSVAIEDVDGDGWLDLLVANEVGKTVSVFRNSATGSVAFAAKVDFAVTGGGPEFVAVQDIDGDGKPEIVTANAGNYLSVFRNQSLPGSISVGSFAAPVDFALNANCCGAWSVAIGDIDF